MKVTFNAPRACRRCSISRRLRITATATGSAPVTMPATPC
jgi:hypothetical protein